MEIIKIYSFISVLLTLNTLFFLGIALAKLNKKMKNIQDKQFDAEEVMELYAMKYSPKPQIITENHDVIPLYAKYSLPRWAEKEVSEAEINKYLVDEISKQIIDYMEIQTEYDIVKMEKVYRARLQVIDMLNGTITYK